MPQISVIVPVYNVEPYIHRCVDSILNQTFSDFELILVDDGSPDNCGWICDEYALKDSRVHVIHQKNGGLSAARNAGIDWIFTNSDSRWITFIDSDDWIHRGYLETLLRAGQKHSVSISMCNFARRSEYQIDEELSPPEGLCLETEQAYIQYYGMCMTACCKLYFRDLFKDLRFPVGKLHEDCYITHIPLFQSEKVAVCDVPLYYYYFNPGSITRAKWNEKRLQEIEAHEIRATWLKNHGYDASYRWEVEVTINTTYEQTEILAKLCSEDKEYDPHFQKLRKMLRNKLEAARKMSICLLSRERIWMYLMAYPTLPVWRFGQWLRGFRNKIK